ncbi:hypothetical protein FOA52_002153 [Chlamydomonas sp. UWO 241]|nr:hypothetical protein FOA52_002153 [Chlamydomonas sp. UWO 241]
MRHASSPCKPRALVTRAAAAAVPTREAPLPTAARGTGFVSLAPASLEGVQSALLWLKHDLRVDDHPGLTAVAAAAAAHSLTSLSVLYVLDPARLGPLLADPAGPEVLSSCLTRLRSELRARGSELVVRTGDAGAVIAAAVEQAGAGAALIAEEEPTCDWSGAMRGAAAAASTSEGGTACYEWHGSAWPLDVFQLNFRTWAGKRGDASFPHPPPASLPPPPPDMAANPGDVPTASQLRQLLFSFHHEPSTSSADEDLLSTLAKVHGGCAAMPEAAVLTAIASQAPDPQELLAAYLAPSPAGAGARGTAAQRVVARSAALAAAAATGARGAVAESVAVAARALEMPHSEGGCFKVLLGPWLELGALSPRRVWAAAARDTGVDPARAASARRAAEVAEFHRQLVTVAGGDARPTDAPGVTVRQFRWRGMRNEYCVARPTVPLPGAPAVMLVHGFGAFGDQWRGNMGALAAQGYTVYAPTLPGYGRSEKSAVVYSQELWTDFLRDFVLQVIGTRVVVAGNSIGGFISASMAADYPQLVSGLVLVNTAGKIDTAFDLVEWQRQCDAKTAPPRWLVALASRGLFWYLESSIPGLLKKLYPINPARADAWLGDEIFRAACDAGAIEVFQSVFYLPPPRALDHLVRDKFKGPTLVLQGVLDPLNDARKRAAEIKAACPDNVAVVLVEAGHCPHDEQPGPVNDALLAFLAQPDVVARRVVAAH